MTSPLDARTHHSEVSPLAVKKKIAAQIKSVLHLSTDVDMLAPDGAIDSGTANGTAWTSGPSTKSANQCPRSSWKRSTRRWRGESAGRSNLE